MRGRAFKFILTGLCGLMVPLLSHGQTRAQCRFSSFSVPSGYYLAGVSGITSSGVIVGQLESKRFKVVAFVRHPDGSFIVYQAPNSYSTWFSKRNDGSVNVGAYQDNNYNSHVHGFVLHGSRFVAVNYPHAAATWLSGINKQGSIVGSYVLSNSQGNGFKLDNGKYTVFHYPGAVATTPNAISDNGVIVGAYASGDLFYGFILRNKTYRRVNHPQSVLGTTLTDVNSSGVIVGEYDDAEEYLHGFIYKNGKFENLVYPGSRNTFAGGINNNGVIAGQVFFQDGSSKGYTAHCK
jgi:uncharacterized membrane protein